MDIKEIKLRILSGALIYNNVETQVLLFTSVSYVFMHTLRDLLYSFLYLTHNCTLYEL